ncbi:uncharacterized protein EHS24_007329 [Apiotrichum porosum]|uniref:Transcription factor TFIIIC triple barrel domain-containing protein n=1 Tax=Apiotrichum porosum TaxID=105984 RepID=A0A427XU52_9TREE|nr:uncharacterized protein EHS24_007329 [Apiotrichum porosum]RSH82362.1 hypothetical protein EHS24_007329 [Apiotrichum porosum]
MLENVYIARHGYRANWEDPSIVTSATGMYHDPPLAQRGLVQAHHLGDFLSDPPAPLPKPDVLYSSPFFRCLQTIQPLAKATGKEVHCEHGVMEWFSKAAPGSGLHARPYPVAELQPHFPDMTLHPTYQSTYLPTRHGETLEELRERSDTFVEAFVRRVETEYPDATTAVIVAHAATLLGDYAHDVQSPTAGVSLYRRKNIVPIAGLEPVDLVYSDDRYPSDKQVATAQSCNGACDGVAHEPVLGDWVLLVNGHTDHLPAGAEANWSFRECEFTPDGQVVLDKGDGEPFTEHDLKPVGLSAGMEQHLCKA